MGRVKKKRKEKGIKVLIFLFFVLVIIAGAAYSIYKYAPTKETMDLSQFYVVGSEDEAVVILNGQYDTGERPQTPKAVISDGIPFINISFLKENIDDGYVYDDIEKVLRYVTDTDVISVNAGELKYSIGRDTIDFNAEIVINRNDSTYLNMDFVSLFSDYSYKFNNSPNRVAIETPGTEKKTASVKKDSAIRRNGGPKSPILKEAAKEEVVWILEDYGRWSKVITMDGVIGCIRNNALTNREDSVVENKLPERVYKHNLLDEKVVMAWHQVASIYPADRLEGLLSNAGPLNVISPTWYKIANNYGDISSISTRDYVDYCHSRGIEVWALVSNIDTPGVDTTSVLNITSSRDNLVNSIVANAIQDNVDGINVDFESLSIEARDGFLEFIRELSLRCKSNNLILSVDNYKPESFNLFYGRREQAKYADYLIIMAYDEHHGDSLEAGSNSSLPFVTEGVEQTLEEVPAEQVVLGLPFYTRIFSEGENGLTNKSISMSAAAELPQKYGVEKVWRAEEQQYYVKYEDQGRTYETWLEDEESLSRKMALVGSQNLGGMSFWKIGFEPDTFWGIVPNYAH